MKSMAARGRLLHERNRAARRVLRLAGRRAWPQMGKHCLVRGQQSKQKENPAGNLAALSSAQARNFGRKSEGDSARTKTQRQTSWIHGKRIRPTARTAEKPNLAPAKSKPKAYASGKCKPMEPGRQWQKLKQKSTRAPENEIRKQKTGAGHWNWNRDQH
jgi:hypothetical protein